MPNLMRLYIAEFTDLPRFGTPAAQLTDRDKVALALAAGVPYRLVRNGTMLRVDLLKPIGVADRGDGGWILGVGK